MLAAADGFGGDNFKKFAMRNIDYMLGENRQHFSYVIGFGNNFPKRPHHRGAYVCLNKLKHKNSLPSVQFQNPIKANPIKGQNRYL